MTTLKVLDLFANFRLRRVEQGLLARAVARLEEVCFGHTNLTAEQATAAFRDICDKSNLKLKVLDLRGNYKLSKVKPRLFVRAVSWLEDVDFRFTELTAKQVNDLCS